MAGQMLECEDRPQRSSPKSGEAARFAPSAGSVTVRPIGVYARVCGRRLARQRLDLARTKELIQSLSALL